MDIGDLIRLIIFGLIFLSFFSGIFERGKGKGEKPARPTELGESGGPRQVRPVARPAPPIEVAPPEGVSRTEARREELRERFGDRRQEQRPTRFPVRTYDDAVESGDITRGEIGGRPAAERDISDMPSPMDTDPEQRARTRRATVAGARRRHPATGGDVLRGSLKDPETLERAFIVKEVLDRPLSLRESR